MHTNSYLYFTRVPLFYFLIKTEKNNINLGGKMFSITCLKLGELNLDSLHTFVSHLAKKVIVEL